MASIKIEDLNANTSMVYLNIDEITEVNGGCPVCVFLLGAAVAAGVEYLLR